MTRASNPAFAIPAALALAGAAGTPGAAAANDLFTINVVEIGNPSNTLGVGGETLPDLVNDLADTAGAFAGFSGTNFSASLNYAGVAGAVQITYLPTGGTGGGELLRIDSLLGTGESFIFDSATGGLGDQLEDFFLETNPDAISDFLSEIAKRSLVAVTDGNPISTTANSADYKFRRFGLHKNFSPTTWELSWMDTNRRPVVPAETANETEDESVPSTTALPTVSINSPGNKLRSRIDAAAAYIDADGFEGSWFQIAPSFELALSDRFSAVLGIPISYHEIEEADVINIGVHLDLPITLAVPDFGSDSGFTWTLTPGAAVDGVGSVDFAAGGVLYSGSVNNRVSYDLPGWSFALSQQISFHEGEQIEVDEFTIDPGVSQQILKLGGKVTWFMNDNAYVFGGYTWTDFLDDAAVDNYQTPTAGVGIRFGDGGTLAASWFMDTGDDFERQAASVTFQLPF